MKNKSQKKKQNMKKQVSKKAKVSKQKVSPSKKASSSIKSKRPLRVPSKQKQKNNQVKKVAKTKKTKKIQKIVKKECWKGYSSSQLSSFRKFQVDMCDFSIQKLKDILKENDQSRSGSKSELIFRIADGMVLGKIPRCPSCFGGRPRFNAKENTYECPGFHDDESFVNCGKVFSGDELKREEWKKV